MMPKKNIWSFCYVLALVCVTLFYILFTLYDILHLIREHTDMLTLSKTSQKLCILAVWTHVGVSG